MTNPSIQIVHADFAAALADVRRIAADLHEHRATAERSVDVLLDGGWSGRAATSYGEGWEHWRAGCNEVLTALDTLADLMDDARRGLVLEDDVVATGFDTGLRVLEARS